MQKLRVLYTVNRRDVGGSQTHLLQVLAFVDPPSFGLRIGRGRSLGHGRRDGNKKRKKHKSARKKTQLMPDRNGQGLPHLQLDGTAKHPVYATAGSATKCRTLNAQFS